MCVLVFCYVSLAFYFSPHRGLQDGAGALEEEEEVCDTS